MMAQRERRRESSLGEHRQDRSYGQRSKLHFLVHPMLITFSFHLAQYSLAWSPDSSTLATSSAASIIQLYDPSTLSATSSFNLSSSSGSSSDPSTQQLGVTFLTPQTLASVSLSGALNILDTRAPEKVVSLWGPSKGITAVGLSVDAGEKEKTFWAGSFDGGVKSVKEDGEWENVGGGAGHKGQVVGVAGGAAGSVHTAGWDDCVREIKGAEGFS